MDQADLEDLASLLQGSLEALEGRPSDLEAQVLQEGHVDRSDLEARQDLPADQLVLISQQAPRLGRLRLAVRVLHHHHLGPLAPEARPKLLRLCWQGLEGQASLLHRVVLVSLSAAVLAVRLK